MKTTFIKIAMLALLATSCEMFDSSAQYTYDYPDYIGDGFDVASLSDVNIDVSAIEEAVNKIYDGHYTEVHSMLIYRNGKLVLDEYFQGHTWKWDGPYHHGEWLTWHHEKPHHIASCTKSVTSALIGIAIDHGFIESVYQSIFDYLPDHQHLRKGGKEQISIEHLLTMTSGLEWKEWSAPYSSTDNPVVGIWFQDKDPISFILGMPLVNTPGSKFNYATGNMVVLGEILSNATNMSIDEFSIKYLFEPLGIDSCYWSTKFENGVDGNELWITPRAMAKIGVTYLNKGEWNGQRIISEEWVERSSHPYSGNTGINIPGEDSGRMGYSYSWWTKEYNESGQTIHLFTASGFGGQHIMVLPESNTVVVFTGGNYLSKRPPFKVLKKYVIPAIDMSQLSNF